PACVEDGARGPRRAAPEALSTSLARLDYTNRQLTEPSRVKDARTESPALGRRTLQMDPLMTTSPAESPRPIRPRLFASQASEFRGWPRTSAAVFVATI